MSSASTSTQRFEEAHFTFALTPQQVQQILTSRYIHFNLPALALGHSSLNLSLHLAPPSHSVVCPFSVPEYSASISVYSPSWESQADILPSPSLLQRGSARSQVRLHHPGAAKVS